MDKKTVLTLVIIALVLASFSIVMNTIDSGEKVSTTVNRVIYANDIGAGKIGVEITPPVVEERGE